MCSFIFSTYQIENLTSANYFARLRGPDATTELKIDGYHLIHNILSITGDFKTQPFNKHDIYCVYNGEIYNYSEFGSNYRSDGECIIDLYEEFGPSFISRIDGEFAILLLDIKRGKLIISSDVFGTKPLWYALADKEIGVASYRSSLDALAYPNVRQISANTTLVIDLNTRSVEYTRPVFNFDLDQLKDSYNDWTEFFELSIKKRAKGQREKLFIGLSSGYDSGAIACELLQQGITFNSYSIPARENIDVLSGRVKLIPHNKLLAISKPEFLAEKKFLLDASEPYSLPPCLPHRPKGYTVTSDSGAVGTGVVCRQAQADGCKIYLSGQGSDEIMSDYGYGGAVAAGFTHSDLSGRFPAELRGVFPWTNFFEGRQREFLYKDEVVGGAYGIECRYPFLDTRLVQEFLWLTPELKNRAYKAPLYHYLTQRKFPYAEGLSSKVGFCANYFGNTEAALEKVKKANRWGRLFKWY